VTTLSQFIADEMTELVGADHAPAIRIPGGLDTHRFSPLGGVARPVPVTGGPLIVTARRLVERTGVEQLVRAMPQVRRSIPDAQLVVLGEGPRRPDIETYVRSAGLEDCIHLLGRVSEDDLVAWYRSADLAVTPTRELEGFGLSTAEALACGTPALVTPVGANPEVVAGLGAAFVAASNRPDDLALSIVEVLSSTSTLEAARRRARDLVHPAMSWESVAARFVDVYRQAPRGVVRAP
jgi:glycosyltransferase involved in cell wall biosynthesis